MFSFQNTACLAGWPLAIHGKVILQLGILNELNVTSTDIYLCLKLRENCIKDKGQVELYAVWRSFKTNSVVYQRLDSRNYPITPITLEMLTEDLPQLLQSLLVSVEQTISRIPFDDLAFPKHPNDVDNDIQMTNNLPSPKIERNESSKCGIKRREIITKKQKPPQNRYTLRRSSLKTEMERDKKDVGTSAAATANTSNNTMPLFCLGGSFPHIDSDEDSADDGIKSLNDRRFSLWFSYRIVLIWNLFFIFLL